MFLLRSLLAVSLIFGLASLSDAAKGAKKAKKNAAVEGMVTAIDPDKDNKDTGTITIKTTAAKKSKKDAAAAPAGEEKKITVSKETQILKADAPTKGKKKAKGELTGTPAKLGDLITGSTLQISLKNGSSTEADKVVITPAKKAKKKKANNNNE
jgi:hypothetical protein